jgi:O-antigen polymerase
MSKYLVYFLFIYLFGVVFFTIQDIPNGIIDSKNYRFLFIGTTSCFIYLTLFLLPVANKVEFNKIDISILLFSIWTIINTILLKHQALSVALSVFICSIILSLILKQFIKNNSTYLFFILASFLIIGGTEALVGFFQLQGFLKSYHYAFKVTGNFHNPGPFGIYVGIIFVVGLGNYFFSENLKLNIISKIVCIICLLIIPSTQSRSAWIGIVVGTLYLLYVKYDFSLLKKYLNDKYIKFVITICTIFLAIVLWNYKANSALGRILMWKVSTVMVQKNPLTGVGFGEFINQYGFYQANYFKNNPHDIVFINLADKVDHAFNDYLQILVENGIFSFLLFIIILYFVLITKPVKVSDYFHPIKAGILVIITASFFSYPLTMIPIWWLFLFFVCLISLNIEDIYYLKIPYLIKILSLFIFGVITINVLSYFSNEYDAKKKWYRANDAVKRENFKITENLYNDAIKNLPNEKSILIDYGIILLINGKPEESVEVLEKASKSVSNQYLFTNLAKGYQQLKKYDLAENAYLQSINMIPNRMYPRYLLAKMYLQKKDTLKAKEIAKQVVEMKVKVSSKKTSDMLIEMRKLLFN